MIARAFIMGAIGMALLPLGALADVGRKAPLIPILIAPAEDTRRVSVTVERGLRSSKPLRTAALRRARDDMHAGNPVAPDDLRQIALAGDGLAAQRYARLLIAGKVAATPSDIAYFSAIAVGTGRIWTLEPMIAAMHKLDPETEPRARIRKYIKVLYPHAWAGNVLALDALVAFNGEGRLFGPLSDRTRDRILAQGKALGDGRTELSLAMGILEVERSKITPDASALEQARRYLVSAEASSHLAVKTTAQNLLRLMENG